MGGDGDFSQMMMTTTVLDPSVVIEDSVVVVDDAQRPDPEVPQRARRRTFTAKYKLEVLAAYDAASGGEKGAVLRREGLYSSHICLLYTSPSPRDGLLSRMTSS